ncbi:hypothetical protein SAMD00019534_116910 [Acytostelium subglobosum LB1]|uniref:hypothetical protein n=1 Tax=Acytostelium subglobosum LB1 TaxID=1410327 RepID=UPI000644E447|nr:hypothetical protein SAMD00019534_116910 [Acytostelium subglobosum LB1]GAM28515.1 hypothetical protein SAMD00019534_116910 [Acytostelium subglobosum LB1]|eukprot:XP_012748554.1 hypothetical protein SAMD00019534_116910 [Acytostelium subglobosum LB1]
MAVGQQLHQQQQQQQQQQLATEDTLKELLYKIETIALKNTKVRECLDLLKQLYRIAINYNSLMADYHTNEQKALKVNPSFVEKLTTLIIDPNTPYKVKILSLSIIAKISESEPQLLYKNLKTFESKVLSLLLSLLISTANNTGGQSSLFVGNIPLISQLGQCLSHASLVSDQKQSAGFFKIGSSSTAAPVTELDGSVSIEFFTVLNNAQVYTEDQSFNIYSFSLLYSWLTSLYKQPATEQTLKFTDSPSSSSPVITSQSTSTSLDSDAGVATTRQLSANFQSTIVSYCLRIIDQSKLKPVGEGGKPVVGETDNLSVIALLESVRILDFLCCLDINLVPKIFPTVQKAYQLHLPSSRTTNANSGHVLLALLQFFVNHSHTLIYDPEPLFRAYFQTYLPRTYMNSFVAFETLNFCIKNKDNLLKDTNVFGLYFPPIFKCLAWFPHSHIAEFSELLPSLISPSTYIEVFHLLLDLPLLTSSMESVLVEQRKYASMGGVDVGDVNDTAWSEYRVLYNYLLRNESGVNINFWSSTTLPLLYQFSKKTPTTPRTIGACELVPSLLHIYFDVLLGYGDRSVFVALLPVLLERIDQTFPFEPYQTAIKETLIGELQSVFNRHPSLVVSERDLLISMVTEGRANADVVTVLCWIIGEYASTSICPEINSVIFNDYHEALELIAYEKINLIKMESLSGATSSSLTPGMANQLQMTRDASVLTGTSSAMSMESANIMLILTSALTKIASRWHEATSRVILCLLKILSYHQYFDAQVISRANECISLLKFPSFAGAVYDCAPLSNRSTYTSSISHDNHSSLSFLLHDPTKAYLTTNPIHPYTLSNPNTSHNQHQHQHQSNDRERDRDQSIIKQ